MTIRLAIASLALLSAPTFAQTPTAPANAVWEVPSHGMIIAEDGNSLRVYSNGAAVCREVAELPMVGGDITITPNADSGAIIAQGVSRYSARRLSDIPAPCRNFRANRASLATFDALVSDFQGYYPFFRARGVDWTANLPAWRTRATAANPQQLWALFEEMLSPLQDSHVTLINGDQRFSRSRNPRATAADPDGIIPNGRSLQAGLLTWLRGPQSPLAAAPTVTGGGYVVHGRLRSGGCYLALLEMQDYAGDDSGIVRDATILSSALDDVSRACSGASSIIIDLRYNPGGDDSHGIALAARIANVPYLAYRKRAYGNGEWAAPYDVTVTPAAANRLPARAAVLIGPRTISAAETTALALRGSGQAQLVGAPAQGALSDVLARALPNGWTLTLSNEEYSAPDGTVLEGRGMQPDIAVAEPTSSMDARFGTALRAAEAALASSAR
jgi:carboxyl-terminal processing protease